MGYAVIPIVASIVLMLHHVVVTDAPSKSKWFVAIVVAASMAVWRFFPQWIVLATLTQVAASVYMLVYLKVQE
ncbi:MAG: hypothetical protein ACE1ZA_09790 [Pseudomonadales bacterium]